MMWNGTYGMMGWGGGLFWPFHFIIPLLFIALIVAAVVMVLRTTTGLGDHPLRAERRSPGIDVLEERYARGEINRDEYQQKRRDILG